MNDAPDREVLLDAISRFLATEVQVADPAIQFRLRIASHLLAGLAREGRTEDEADAAHLRALLGPEAPIPAGRGERQAAIRAATADLAVRIRSGALDEELGPHARTLHGIALAKARVGNPRFE